MGIGQMLAKSASVGYDPERLSLVLSDDEELAKNVTAAATNGH